VTPPFTVIVKTILRPKCCTRVVKSWKLRYPEAEIIVVDDGPPGRRPSLEGISGVRHIKTEFDIGLSAGRNLGVAEAKNDLVFICDDDNACHWETDIAEASRQMERLGAVIVGVGAGSLDYRSDAGELRVFMNLTPQSPAICDAVQNHFLARKDALPAWNEKRKINNHADFFLMCKERGVVVAATPSITYRKTKKEAVAERSKAYSRLRSGRCRHMAKLLAEERGINSTVWRYSRGGASHEFFKKRCNEMGLSLVVCKDTGLYRFKNGK
jgi:glycosyltransferase involved in cell wall biosynthesis